MSGHDDDKLNFARDQVTKDIIMGTTTGAQNTRFQPGKSGNPNGRPKKPPAENPAFSASPIFKAARSVSRTTVTIAEGGVMKEVATYEAMLRSLVFRGIKGNAYAAYKAMEIMKEAELREVRDLEQERAFWNWYKESYCILQDAAKKENVTIELPILHPDDVIVNDSGPVRFAGPWNETGQRQMQQTLVFRELLFLQDAYDERFGPRKKPGQPYKSAAYIFLHFLEKTLPQRLRLSEGQWLDHILRARRITKLDLLRMLYRGWRTINPHYRRGTVFPNCEWAKKLLTANFKCLAIFQKHVTPETTPEEMVAHSEAGQAITEFLTIKFRPEY